jgi:hypothetical protein
MVNLSPGYPKRPVLFSDFEILLNLGRDLVNCIAKYLVGSGYRLQVIT